MTSGTKHDDGKAPMHLLPGDALTEVAHVLAFGAKKYHAYNWHKGFAWSRLLAAAIRHLFAYADGERVDVETGRSHLAHAACMILFLLAHEQRNIGNDDLPNFKNDTFED